MLRDFIQSKFDSRSKNKLKSKSSTSDPKHARKNSEEESLDSKQNEIIHRKTTNSEKNQINDKSQLNHQIKEKDKEFIGHLEHVPNFIVKDNEYIRTGYRINFHTPKRALKSLFMVHNELVNIWSHLGGAIMLLILCAGLCLSVSSINPQNLKQEVQMEIHQLFDAINNKIPNFSRIEHDLSEKLSQTREDLSNFGGNAISNIESKLETIANEIANAKKNVNPEAVGRLLVQLKDHLDAIPNNLNDLKTSISQSLDINKLENAIKSLKEDLNELKVELIQKIDSSDYDWVDIYKYTNPTYNPTQIKDGELHLSRWPIIVFLFSAAFCLLCSACFHLFYCLSHTVNKILLRLDYAGISILITGSCFPPFLYGFYCQPFYAKLYLSLIGVSSIIVFFVSLSDTIHMVKYRKLKSIMYGGLGIFAAVPAPHLLYLTFTISDQNDNLDILPAIPYYLAMGFSYLGGLTVYASKCPERYKPGKFDICGHSHQIWHLCVLLGIILTYFGAFDNYYSRLGRPCLCN